MFLVPPPSRASTSGPGPQVQTSTANDNHHEPDTIQRAKKACNRCRVRKVKCDGKYPCGRCRHDDVPCLLGRKDRGDVKELSRGYIRALETQQAYLLDALKALSSRGPEDAGLKNIIARLEASGLDVSAIRNPPKEAPQQRNGSQTPVEQHGTYLEMKSRALVPGVEEAIPLESKNQVGIGSYTDIPTANTLSATAGLPGSVTAQNGGVTDSAQTLELPSAVLSNVLNLTDDSMTNDIVMPALDDPTFADQWWENWINISQAMDTGPHSTSFPDQQQG